MSEGNSGPGRACQVTPDDENSARQLYKLYGPDELRALTCQATRALELHAKPNGKPGELKTPHDFADAITATAQEYGYVVVYYDHPRDPEGVLLGLDPAPGTAPGKTMLFSFTYTEYE